MNALCTKICAACTFLALLFATTAARAALAPGVMPVPLTTAAALHEGNVTGDRIVWRTSLFDNVAPQEVGGFAIGLADMVIVRIPLAHPLPRSTITRDVDTTLVPGEDGFVAIDVRSTVLHARSLTIETIQPLSGTEVVLTPPIVAGRTPQVIVVSGPDGRRFQGDASLRLVRHVGFLSSDDVDTEARHACAAFAGTRGLPLDAEPIYVRGTSPLAVSIRGRITTAEERNRPGGIAAAIAFLVISGVLVVLYRRLTASAQVERADAELRSVFDSLKKH